MSDAWPYLEDEEDHGEEGWRGPRFYCYYVKPGEREVTKEKMAMVMKDLQEREMEMREAGQKEYAHDDNDAFANFRRVAEATGLNMQEVLFVYLLKHIDGIAAYIKGHRSQRESIQGRIVDARVYLALLSGMIYEGKGDAPLDKDVTIRVDPTEKDPFQTFL